jgi:mRNA interferase RelE/StbE
MSYRVELETQARREFLDLAGSIQARLEEAIDDLKRNPRPPGVKRLIGSKGYRIRKGDYRVLYTIDDASRVIRIYRIGHRREVYRR